MVSILSRFITIVIFEFLWVGTKGSIARTKVHGYHAMEITALIMHPEPFRASSDILLSYLLSPKYCRPIEDSLSMQSLTPNTTSIPKYPPWSSTNYARKAHKIYSSCPIFQSTFPVHESCHYFVNLEFSALFCYLIFNIEKSIQCIDSVQLAVQNTVYCE